MVLLTVRKTEDIIDGQFLGWLYGIVVHAMRKTIEVIFMVKKID